MNRLQIPSRTFVPKRCRSVPKNIPTIQTYELQKHSIWTQTCDFVFSATFDSRSHQFSTSKLRLLYMVHFLEHSGRIVLICGDWRNKILSVNVLTFARLR
ncbi:hypothetical protein BLNAU_149 [Blattamonas nauphoetae]|uniref:Uncharacterized protein n=1 Tax=Blattamonas nauphoetae TaxID=2049346 RepID=A0ABQ9YMS5_9EUKA|nr:hypothetical protein BLNAU_149 [Blattamonas nauphoetae]